MKKDITIKVQVYGETHELTTYAGEYRNLMVLIYDKIYVEDFGECRGLGRCGSCHILVLNAPDGMVFHDGVEKTTLSRLPNTRDISHLACQIMIDKSIHGLAVQIVEESDYSYV